MSDKIVFFSRDKVAVAPLLHQILEREGVEAVLVAVRVDGRWWTTWGGDLDHRSLAMAAMKTFRDVSDAIQEDS